MWNTKVRAVGTSSGVILPKGACQALNVHKGDDVSLVMTKTGLELRPSEQNATSDTPSKSTDHDS